MIKQLSKILQEFTERDQKQKEKEEKEEKERREKEPQMEQEEEEKPAIDMPSKAFFYNCSKFGLLAIEVRCSKLAATAVANRFCAMLDPLGPMKLESADYCKFQCFTMRMCFNHDGDIEEDFSEIEEQVDQQFSNFYTDMINETQQHQHQQQ